jgi:hypothetical protein
MLVSAKRPGLRSRRKWLRRHNIWAALTWSSVDTIGVHYSATIWRWYRNWLNNEKDVTAKYGARWFRVSIE